MAAHVLTTKVFSISPADQHIAYAAVPWVAVTWLLSQLSAQFTAVPSAMQKYSIVSTGSTICGALTLGSGLLSLAMGGNLMAVLEVRTAAAFAITLSWGYVAKRLLPSLTLRLSITKTTFGRCMHFGVWQLVATAGGMVSGNADKAILGMYLSEVAVGLFAIPQTIVVVMYGLTYRAADVLLPAVSAMDSTAGRGRSFWVTIRVGWVLSLITTAAMGCFVIMGNDILRLYVGRVIAESSGRLLTLIAITAIASSSSPALNQYLLGIGDTKRTALISICSGVINISGALLLVPRLGLNGAAWSDLVAIILVRPVMHMLIWRGSARSIPFATVASYLYGPAMVGIPLSLALRGVRKSIGWECGWFGLAICCVVCGLIIVAAVVLCDRALPGWKQRESDSKQLFAQLWRVQQRAFVALATAAGK
jgi:O-antigen/teichoic acid export membrane protein